MLNLKTTDQQCVCCIPRHEPLNVKVHEDLHVTVEHKRHIDYLLSVIIIRTEGDFFVRAMLSVHYVFHHCLFQLVGTSNGDIRQAWVNTCGSCHVFLM